MSISNTMSRQSGSEVSLKKKRKSVNNRMSLSDLSSLLDENQTRIVDELVVRLESMLTLDNLEKIYLAKKRHEEMMEKLGPECTIPDENKIDIIQRFIHEVGESHREKKAHVLDMRTKRDKLANSNTDAVQSIETLIGLDTVDDCNKEILVKMLDKQNAEIRALDEQIEMETAILNAVYMPFQGMFNAPSCKVCYDRDIDTAFQPCGHLICKTCHDNLPKDVDTDSDDSEFETEALQCPFCHQPVYDSMKIYFS